MNEVRINWIPFGGKEMGSSRTNVWDVHEELLKMDGVVSTVAGDDWDNYDVTIFQKNYDKKLFRYVKKKCVVGFSVGDDHMKFVKPIKKSDFIVCSCEALKNEIVKFNKNCHVVLEGENLNRNTKLKVHENKDEIVLLYHGFKENISHLQGHVAAAINHLKLDKKLKVKIISNFNDLVHIPFFNVPVVMCRWGLDTFNEEALEGDIGIIPQGDEAVFGLKSANKIRTLMAMKIPVIGDGRNMDYCQTLDNGKYGFIGRGAESWASAIENLASSFDVRNKYAELGYKRVIDDYTTQNAALQLLSVVRQYI